MISRSQMMNSLPCLASQILLSWWVHIFPLTKYSNQIRHSLLYFHWFYLYHCTSVAIFLPQLTMYFKSSNTYQKTNMTAIVLRFQISWNMICTSKRLWIINLILLYDLSTSQVMSIAALCHCYNLLRNWMFNSIQTLTGYAGHILQRKYSPKKT